MSYCINKEDSSWSKQIHNQRSGFSSTKLRSLLQKHQPENVHVFNHYKKTCSCSWPKGKPEVSRRVEEVQSPPPLLYSPVSIYV